MENMSRLDDRVRKLQGHFALTAKDIDQIVTSADKLARRGQKIEALEFGAEAAGSPESPGASEPSVGSRTGQLRLRVVDGDD